MTEGAWGVGATAGQQGLDQRSGVGTGLPRSATYPGRWERLAWLQAGPGGGSRAGGGMELGGAYLKEDEHSQEGRSGEGGAETWKALRAGTRSWASLAGSLGLRHSMTRATLLPGGAGRSATDAFSRRAPRGGLLLRLSPPRFTNDSPHILLFA